MIIFTSNFQKLFNNFNNKIVLLNTMTESLYLEFLYFNIREKYYFIKPIKERKKTLKDFQNEIILKISNYNKDLEEEILFEKVYQEHNYRDLEFNKQKKRKW